MQLLQNELGNRAYLGELDSDSSNVVDLVERLYNVRHTCILPNKTTDSIILCALHVQPEMNVLS